jgi:hypothetical protein
MLRAKVVVAFLDDGSRAKLNELASKDAFGTPLIASCAGQPEFPFKYAFHEDHEFLDPEGWEDIQFDLIEIFLDAGANPNLTYRCFSPLIVLVCSTSRKKSKAIKLLLEHSADPEFVVPKYSCEVNPRNAGDSHFRLTNDSVLEDRLRPLRNQRKLLDSY